MATKKLTRKQLAFINEFKKDPTASYTELAKRAGYTPATARNAASRTVEACRSVLFEEMRKAGVNEVVVAQKVQEGLNAFSIREHYNAKTGEIVPGRPQVDFSTRHKYLDTYMRLQGVLRDVIEHQGSVEITPVELTPSREAQLENELNVVFGKKKRHRK